MGIGRVYKSTGSFYSVKDEQGQFWVCRIKGKLRIDQSIKSTNPIAVGDYVVFEVEDEATLKGVIKSINARENYIVRVSPHNKNQKHIIASNLDQAIIIATLTDPRTSLGFIDRFLLTTELYHIPAIIVFNKADLIARYGMEEELAFVQSIYEDIGYEVINTSTLTAEGLGTLKERLAQKTTMLTGHSGVGKSTLVNTLDPALDVRVGEISDWTGKGQHTTTFAEMFDLSGGGSIIDTPGIKEFGLIDVTQTEVKEYFPEMRALQHQCKFNNCMHLNEPQCAVKDALGTRAMSEVRYGSYLSMLETLNHSLY